MQSAISPCDIHEETQRVIAGNVDPNGLSAVLTRKVRGGAPVHQHLMDTECLRLAAKFLDAVATGWKPAARVKKAWRELMIHIRTFYHRSQTTDGICLSRIETRAKGLRLI